MLTPRNIILLSVGVFVFAMLWTVYDVTRPPDSGGAGADSFGTRAFGQRGLFETLSELNLPVTRQIAPPGDDLPSEGTYVLCGPDPWLVGTEPRYVERLRRWVERGGRILVAPSTDHASALMLMDAEFARTVNSDVLDLLGLSGMYTRRVFARDLPVVFTGDSGEEAQPVTNARLRLLPESFDREYVAIGTVPVATSGSLDGLEGVEHLAVPRDEVKILDCGDHEPRGSVLFEDPDGQERILVAQFPYGAGEIVVVSDPRLLSNAVLARADNSVLAVNLLAESEGAIVFDEFYHGLSVRGNPFYLLSRAEYAVVTLGMLLAIGVYTWRQAVLLGPPLMTPEPSRRAIGEYLNAMARLFERGRGARRFVLWEVWRGVARQLQREFHLPASKPDVESIARAIRRRDPQRAERFCKAAQAVDAALAKGDNCGHIQTVAAIQGITACL